MQQTFPAGTGQHISIAHVAGDLKVRGWDQQVISVTSDGNIGILQPEGDVLMIHDCEDAVELAVPYEQIITARDIDGDVSAENVRQIEIQEVNGSVSLKAITGEVILGHIDGDLVVEKVPQVHARGNINGEVRCEGVDQLEVSAVGGSLELKEGTEASFSNVGGDVDISNTITVRGGHVGGDCQIRGNGDNAVVLKNIGQDLDVSGVAKLQVHNVGKGCQVHDSERAELMIGHVGINLEIAGASSLRAHNVGCDCNLRDVQGNISVDHIGSSVTVAGAAGNLQIGNIGGNAELKGIGGLLGVGSAGGNIFVEASFPPESVTRLRAGGNVHLVLPSNANLTIQATVGGIVHSQAAVSAMGNHITLVYGDGAARLEVNAGGNLELYGNQAPNSTSTYSGNWENSAHDWQNQWQDMARQWNDASAEFAAGFGASFTDKFTRAAEKQQRKAEKYRQKVERQARSASERTARMNIRINNREWRMDPQRIDHIVAEAYEAAARGTQGAVEAVEQALKNLHVASPFPPSPPRPPKPPTSPSSGPSKPTYGTHDVNIDVNVGASPEPPRGSESTDAATGTTGKPAADPEQERIAILRMVADGRITPEEGDMLLEAL
ncbi:MAG TPA: hypothetical protein VGL94_04810 [Ktedonobacteraceae bacterium]